MDTGHLSRTGTAKLAPWLVDKITPILREAEERP
jgi:lysophospholipase L1-like esterase